jgi:formylmethanofuran dehydrogenase subunit B
MIDYLIVNELLKLIKNKEQKPQEQIKEHYNTPISTIISTIITGFKTLLIFICIGFTAAVLSWRCNSNANYPLSTKLVCSLNAFTYGTIYLIYYGIMYLNYGETLCIINSQ